MSSKRQLYKGGDLKCKINIWRLFITHSRIWAWTRNSNSGISWRLEIQLPGHIFTPAVHLYTCTPVHSHTCIPAHLNTCTPAHLHTCTPAHLYTCTPANLQTCTHAHMHTCTPVHLYTCTLAHPDVNKNDFQDKFAGYRF